MQKERLYQIDLLRFLAAIFVVLYHYTFRGYNSNIKLSPVEFSGLEEITKYGYLGVDLFFIISGFVIIMSIENCNTLHFIKSRIIRLYPAYWVCLITTTLLTITLVKENTINLKQFLFNFTMLNGYFNVPHIDGVYWSLLVEIKFYFLIVILLSFPFLKKHFNYFIIIWLAFSIINLIPNIINYKVFNLLNNYLILEYSSYFIAGYFFYTIYKRKTNTHLGFMFIFICFTISLTHAIERISRLNKYYSSDFNVLTIASIIILFYGVFLLLSLRKLNFLNKSLFFTLGIITYPLYLIHQNIGYFLFKKFSSINNYLLLFFILSLMLFTSYIINKFFERKIGKFLKEKLNF